MKMPYVSRLAAQGAPFIVIFLAIVIGTFDFLRKNISGENIFGFLTLATIVMTLPIGLFFGVKELTKKFNAKHEFNKATKWQKYGEIFKNILIFLAFLLMMGAMIPFAIYEFQMSFPR